MLPKSKRLKTEAFNEIIEKGQTFHGPFLIVKILNTKGNSHFAVSVPKKVAKTAVLRNKMRRRVYSIIAKNENKIKQGFNVIIILKVGITDFDIKALSDEIGKIFVKSSLLK